MRTATWSFTRSFRCSLPLFGSDETVGGRGKTEGGQREGTSGGYRIHHTVFNVFKTGFYVVATINLRAVVERSSLVHVGSLGITWRLLLSVPE